MRWGGGWTLSFKLKEWSHSDINNSKMKDYKCQSFILLNPSINRFLNCAISPPCFIVFGKWAAHQPLAEWAIIGLPFGMEGRVSARRAGTVSLHSSLIVPTHWLDFQVAFLCSSYCQIPGGDNDVMARPGPAGPDFKCKVQIGRWSTKPPNFAVP